MGCSSSSTSKIDAAPAAKDGPPAATDVLNVPAPDAAPDALPAPGDVGPAVNPDAAADKLPTPGDVGPALMPDAAPDALPVPGDTGPAVTPDAAADKLPTPGDVGPVGKPDAAADKLPTPGDVGPVGTPDAAADKLPAPGDLGGTGGVIGTGGDAAVDSSAATGDAGPVATVDATGDGNADGGAAAADAAAPTDSSGAAKDSSPVACTPFIGGLIAADLTLTKACSPYRIVEYIQVNGAILTIEPGVTLSFDGDIGIEIGNSDTGGLIAVGTTQDPITFTSSASPPLPGDWGAIRLFDGTMPGTQIAYAKLDYCGADRSGCIVGDGVSPSTVTIDHVTIDHVGADSDGILEWDNDSNFVITNSTFSNIPDGQYAISSQASSFAGISAGNTFNGGAMIEIAGGTISSTASWVDPGTPVAVTGSLWLEGLGNDNPVLTIGAGMTLMLAATNPPVEFSVGFGGAGSLVIAGTPTKRVTLTSLAPSPDLGDWVGVEVWGSGAAQISYADISYAGSDGVSGGGDLIVENGNSAAQIVVDHSSFTYSRGYGIYVDCAGPTVTPQTTVTLNAGITYAHNESDPTNTGDPSDNVGPGLNGPNCTIHHHH